MTAAANDVVMVVVSRIEFIPVGAIAKVAPADEIDLLHRGEAAVDRHQVADALHLSRATLLR
jgi:hypothetical protein